MTEDSPLSIAPDGTCDNAAHTCTASVAGDHTITATQLQGAHPVDTVHIQVNASQVIDHAVLLGGSASIAAGQTTAAYEVHGIDAHGNDIGDLTAFSGLSITPSEPGASCDQITHTCTATIADTAKRRPHRDCDARRRIHGYRRSHRHARPDRPPRAERRQRLDSAGTPTAPYVVHGRDAYGNDTGDVTAGSAAVDRPRRHVR